MSSRKTPFINGEFYHIYNRGTDKRIIFSDQDDLGRFFQGMREFNSLEPIGSLYEKTFADKKFGGKASKLAESNKLVNFVAYCLNPNHFHFILKQIEEDGISKFMQRLGTGYAVYFNEKYNRNGALFQGKFKAIHIDSNEYLLHLSVYVNLNDRVHKLGGKASKFMNSESSFGEYIDGVDNQFCKKDIVLGQFKNVEEYKTFAKKSLKNILEKRYDADGMGELLLEE